MRPEIEKAYQLINTPIDPNLRVPFELANIVDYGEAEAGETVEYFNTDSSAVDGIYDISAAGTLTYNKIVLRTPVALPFDGLQSKLETVLIDEILNSKDQSALAVKKDSIIRSMDKEEVRRVLSGILALDGDTGEADQEVIPGTGDDILRVIIALKRKIENYATDSVLLLGSAAYAKYETYDLDNVGDFGYKLTIAEILASLKVNSVIKVIGELEVNDSPTQLLGVNMAILVGRDSTLAKGKPIKMFRRKFSGEIAKLSGAEEGAVRLVSIAETPQPINAEGANTLGYGCYGYESISLVITNYRALAWADCSSILA